MSAEEAPAEAPGARKKGEHGGAARERWRGCDRPRGRGVRAGALAGGLSGLRRDGSARACWGSGGASSAGRPLWGNLHAVTARC